jgi:hypothetical protein
MISSEDGMLNWHSDAQLRKQAGPSPVSARHAAIFTDASRKQSAKKPSGKAVTRLDKTTEVRDLLPDNPQSGKMSMLLKSTTRASMEEREGFPVKFEIKWTRSTSTVRRSA